MTDDEAFELLRRASRMIYGGSAAKESWLRPLVATLHELGYEITPSACPTCDRWLALSCAVCGQVGE